MAGGSGASISTKNYSMCIAIDPVIIRAIDVLGKGPNLEAKLTEILNKLLTDRLEDINARILECQAEDLKNEEEEEANENEEDESAQMSKRSAAAQQQLMTLRHLLSTYKAPPTGEKEKDHKMSEITINLAQFAAIHTLGDKKTRILDLDLGSMLLDLGNITLTQLNLRLAKEIAEKGEKPVSLEQPNPDLLQQKEFLSLLGDLEKVTKKMMERSRRIYHIQGGIDLLVDTCASVLQIPASEVQSAVDKLLQKEQSVVDSLSYEVLYDKFARNVQDFESIAQLVSLDRKISEQLGKAQITKLIKKKTRKRAASKKRIEKKAETPQLEQPPTMAISDITILDNLTTEPIDIRNLIAKMGIKDMSDARYLQIQLRQLEKNQKIYAKIIRGNKHYWKT